MMEVSVIEGKVLVSLVDGIKSRRRSTNLEWVKKGFKKGARGTVPGEGAVRKPECIIDSWPNVFASKGWPSLSYAFEQSTRNAQMSAA
jgi:hypothetical protein